LHRRSRARPRCEQRGEHQGESKYATHHYQQLSAERSAR
jgi:hypothetical protein